MDSTAGMKPAMSSGQDAMFYTRENGHNAAIKRPVVPIGNF